MAKFDAVVVGAGNAGLAAATKLALSGKKILLIEQHNLPGGCATSFVRGRFEFDPSLHELCSVGSEQNPGSVRSMLNRFGIKLNWCKVDDCFRIISTYSDGSPMDVTMPSGQDAFIEKMEYYVPGSKANLVKMFDLLKEIDEGINFVTNNGVTEVNELINLYPNFLRVGIYNCTKVFKALKLSQKCIDILSTYWSYLGVDMDNLSFVHYAVMVRSYVVYGAYIPSHTSHEISVAFTERLRELGVTMWFNCRAEKFLFNGDRLCGIKTSKGTVECDFALANINQDIIYGKMMPKELVPENEKRLSAARNRNFSARMFTAYFGLNKTAAELGIKDYSIFMAGSADSTKEYKSIQCVETNKNGIFLCYNIANPEFSPKGTAVCSFTTMFGKQDWENLEPEEYLSLKQQIAERLIAQLKEQAGIDIAPHIEEMSIATPLTFARYLGTPEGCVYGYEASGWDGIIARTMNVDNEYKIKGLLPIGTSGTRGDGYSSAYLNGEMMADAAIKQLNERGE